MFLNETYCFPISLVLSSDDDVISMDVPSQSLRYEVPLLKRDERLMDIRRAAKEEEKENKEGIHKLRSKYNKQYSDYHNIKENLKKQSNMQLKGFKKTVSFFSWALFEFQKEIEMIAAIFELSLQSIC